MASKKAKRETKYTPLLEAVRALNNAQKVCDTYREYPLDHKWARQAAQQRDMYLKHVLTIWPGTTPLTRCEQCDTLRETIEDITKERNQYESLLAQIAAIVELFQRYLRTRLSCFACACATGEEDEDVDR